MTCDGTSKQALRRFLESLEIAQLWSHADDKAILELASRLVTGNLASAMSKFVHTENDGKATWQQTKEHIKEQFLGKDEKSALRSQLLRMAQTNYETVESYGRRFNQKSTWQDLPQPQSHTSFLNVAPCNLFFMRRPSVPFALK